MFRPAAFPRVSALFRPTRCSSPPSAMAMTCGISFARGIAAKTPVEWAGRFTTTTASQGQQRSSAKPSWRSKLIPLWRPSGTRLRSTSRLLVTVEVSLSRRQVPSQRWLLCRWRDSFRSSGPERHRSRRPNRPLGFTSGHGAPLRHLLLFRHRRRPLPWSSQKRLRRQR